MSKIIFAAVAIFGFILLVWATSVNLLAAFRGPSRPPRRGGIAMRTLPWAGPDAVPG